MFAPSKIKGRKIPPSHKWWNAHPYQERAVDFLLERGAAALFLDPGLGKTSITLEAFDILRKEGIAKKMLVIAPLRVCQLVWEQEAQGWTQFRHLKFTTLHGPKKGERLNDSSDIFLINPEGVAWLQKELWGKKMPFDTVVIDELTKFKNAQSVRFKALFPMIQKAQRRWGLTGTPIPNGYLDLFGQMKILDDGVALGFYYTHYRNKYFEKDYTGFGYDLRRGADKAIEKAIKPYVLRMSSDDYLDLPPLIDDIISVEMPKKARKHYMEMKKEMIVELEGNDVEAGNAAAVYSKLKQMANGAVYHGDGIFEPRKVIHLHDAKIEALQELIEELAGTPLLVAYEFNHDLWRIKKALGGDIPYLGSGVSAAKARQIEKDWNANKIPVLLCHPASAGHGLNFQKGNACHIAWFSVTWDYELYDQLIKRIFRQGNKATRIFNHIFIVENTIDNKTRDAIIEKGFKQSKFFDALNAEIYQEGNSDTSPYEDMKQSKDSEMVRKLKRKERASEVDEDEDEDEVETPRRSSRRSSRRGAAEVLREEELEEDEDEDEDEDEAPRKSRRSSRSTSGTKRKLRGKHVYDDEGDEDGEEEKDEPVSRRARKNFSKAVQDKLDLDDEDDHAALDEAEEETAPKKRAVKKSSRETTKSPREIAAQKVAERLANSDDLDTAEFATLVSLIANF